MTLAGGDGDGLRAELLERCDARGCVGLEASLGAIVAPELAVVAVSPGVHVAPAAVTRASAAAELPARGADRNTHMLVAVEELGDRECVRAAAGHSHHALDQLLATALRLPEQRADERRSEARLLVAVAQLAELALAVSVQFSANYSYFLRSNARK